MGHLPPRDAIGMSAVHENSAYTQWQSEHARALAEHKLPVSEIFGPTLQGEGPYAGQACWFIRLGGCNLSCVWCDTPYATGQHGTPMSQVAKRSIDDILATIPAGWRVILTGGEPLMHTGMPAFQLLLAGLQAKQAEIHVETNGMFVPDTATGALISHFTVSPKINVAMRHANHHPSLGDWHDHQAKTAMKWVVDGLDQPGVLAALPERVARIRQLSQDHGVPAGQVWLMPEGELLPDLQKHWADIAQAAADAGVNATHRLHTLAWGNEPGR